MILSDRQIKDAVAEKKIEITPYEEDQVQPASYDLRVGKQAGTTSTKKLIDMEETSYLVIGPGDFAIVTTFEVVKLDASHVARFGLRSKYSRKGLVATTGPQIDPGYHGRLIIGLTNLTPHPITLPYKDEIVSVEFHRLEKPAEKPYCGPYQGKVEFGADEIEAITEGSGLALSEVLTTLGSVSRNVGELNVSVTTFSHEMKVLKWVMGVGLTVLGLLIAIASLIIAAKPA